MRDFFVCWLLATLFIRSTGQVTTLLGDSGYTTFGDVSGWASLSLDIGNMQDATDASEMRDIYENGKNAKYTDEDGNEKVRSLASLSVGAFDDLKDDAMFNFFRHAFLKLGSEVEGEDLGLFDQKPVAEYANTLVLDLLALDKLTPVPQAAMIMNVWMYVVHELYEVIRACQRNDDQTVSDMEKALDVVAALWIGVGQEKGDEDSGNLLYNLAEKAGGHFNQRLNGQSMVNSEILGALETFKLAIGTGECSKDANAYQNLRTLVRHVIGQMSIPFIQMMIHHISEPASTVNADFIELYALSLGARVEACIPTTWNDMLELFVRKGFEDGFSEAKQREAIQLLQSIYPCVEVTCALVGSYRSGEVPECTEVSTELVSFAGYPQTFEARPASRIDVDIEQIRILTKASAYVAALDYYTYGYNAVEDGKKVLPLKTLARSTARSVVITQFELFSSFFDSPDYADAIVTEALNGSGNFVGASPDQISEVVSGVLTNLVMYMAVLERAYASVTTCKAGGANATDDSVFEIDQAVAFYVGSIEGPSEGGRPGGQMLYAAAKQFCGEFGVCTNTTTGDATANVDIIMAFQDVSDYLVQSLCSEAEAILIKQVAPGLLVPLIQGTLSYAASNAELTVGTTEGDLGTGYAYSRSILPLIDAADRASGTILARNMDFSLIDKPVGDGAEDVFNAVKSGIQLLTTPSIAEECPVIGVYFDVTYGDVCDGLEFTPRPPTSPSPTVASTPAPATAPIDGNPGPSEPVSTAPTKSPADRPPASPSDLGFGRYFFENDVTNIAALSEDVRDMKNASSADTAADIYENGGSSVVSGGVVVSLAAITKTAASTMSQDPMFNIFRWALLEESVLDDIDTDNFDPLASAYADIVVQKALTVANDLPLAAETAVVMVIWMEICHELYNAISYCSDADSDSSVRSVDRAAALWLGLEQEEGSFSTGAMMYHIAQQAEKNFGLPSGEALANTKILESLSEAQSVGKGCTQDRTNFLEMKVVVSQIIKQMTIPLLQNLIYYINKGTDNYMELYALSSIPQAIACGSSDFIGLRDVLLDVKNFNPQNIDDVFEQEMKRFQKCLRIKCSDILGNARPSGSPLRDLIDRLCNDVEEGAETTLVGYEAVSNVYEISRLDLDILQIGILMETKAYEAAADLYENGYNSHGILKPNSLLELAKSDNRKVVPQFQNFSAYFKSDDYAHELVMNGIERQNTFQGASRDQAAETVTRALQGVVSYMAVLEKWYTAIDLCDKGSGAVQSWEEGIALYVGSLEGPEAGGGGTWDGTLLYALGKETCDAFGTCEGNGDAQINEDIMETLSTARDLLEQNKCDETKGALNDILGDLPVPLIQGVLFYASENAGLEPGNATYALAAADVFARAILPLVDSVNSTSAATLSEQLSFDLVTQPVRSGADVVFEAITFALTGMDVDCDDIGEYNSRSVCNPDVVAPVADTPTSLASGIYITTTYVQDRADIALDLLAIREALESGSTDLARIVYKEGENSKIYNENGIKVGQRSLERFSTVATVSMMHEPLLNIYRHALGDSSGLYMGRDSRLYADSIVNDLLTSVDQTQKVLAGEAMLVLNLWMYLVHELFETLKNCKNKVIADTDGVHSIDEAVAYWIGDGQIAGDGNNGHLFYALAERMGEQFQMDVNGQSRTNSNILKYFEEAKLLLSFPNACSENPITYPKLREIVHRILSQMTIPLIQSLIHSLRVNKRQSVKLYAQSIVPLISACNPGLFSYLQLKLIELDYNVIETEDIVDKLRSAYDCLGITCDDIGKHTTETDNVCVPTPIKNPLAGYIPNTDVRDYAQIDLDILEASILMKMEAHEAVQDLYFHGKHVTVDGIGGPQLISLHQMATTSDRSVVPQFDSFVRYNEDNKYADTIIRNALDSSKLPNASAIQRTEIVIKSMQYLILYMSVLQAMHDAIADCQSTDGNRFTAAQSAWDRAAALLIGSIEGFIEGGDEMNNGQSFYALGKSRCAQFGTCGKEGVSSANEQLLSLLYTGKGELEGGSCNALKRAVGEIESVLLVPLIQSNLHFAIVNAKLVKFTESGDYAQGYVFSRAVLPLVQDVNRKSAEIIDRNMNFQFDTEPIPDGTIAVVNAFAPAYSGMNVDCTQLGTVEGIEPCSGATKISSASSSSNAGMVVGILFGVFAAVGLATFVVLRKRKRKKQMEGDMAPMFRRSNGVMNHTTNDILDGGKLNDADVIDGDEHFGHRMQVHADSLSMA